MRELRLSIPFVGGITAIYTPQEVQQKKEAVVKRVRSTAGVIKALGSKAYGLSVEVLGDVQHRASTLSFSELKDVLKK